MMNDDIFAGKSKKLFHTMFPQFRFLFFVSCPLFLVSCFLFLVSCNPDLLERLDVDVSHIKIHPVKIQRFDRDFFSLNAENIPQQLPGLRQKYPGFTDLFVKNILCRSGIEDNACIPEIIRFVNDKDMHEAFQNCQTIFPDMKETEEKLTSVFRYFKYYFPGRKLPVVYTMMSGFNYSIARADTVFAIGLEMYLGRKSKFYEMMQVPNYKRLTMQKEYIVNDFVRAWMMEIFPNTTKNKTLLSEMIYEGKLLYLADALIPQEDDTIKTGFTKKQLRWCIEHESDMWGFLIKNKFLYSSELSVISKFTGEGPFTAGFAKESPARTGVWLGWQIVRRYMAHHSEITLEQLMSETDAQKILTLSKYKP
jgi:gliding motility-associated lipoprotein GldB